MRNYVASNLYEEYTREISRGHPRRDEDKISSKRIIVSPPKSPYHALVGNTIKDVLGKREVKAIN